MLTVFPPALDGLHPTKKGSAWLRVQKFRGSFDVVHFRYGPSVPFPQHSTPPRGDAVEFLFRREQSNSTGGTFTHVETSFTGAGFVPFCEENRSKLRKRRADSKDFGLRLRILPKLSVSEF